MYYLGIETSCDETSLALLKKNPHNGGFVSYINSHEVVASVVSSQINIHKEFGGVVPEIGARQHAQYIHLLMGLLLSKVGQGVQSTVQTTELKVELFSLDDYKEVLTQIDVIYVTTSPGLVSALKVGLEFAKTLSYFIKQKYSRDIAIEHINHLHGHVISSFYGNKALSTLSDKEVFPHLHLLVSGGNSQLLLLESPNKWEIVGQTLDDAAGESFDKAGRLLGLPYPAGVSISKIAGQHAENIHNLPRGMVKTKELKYSFSGLKTAVRYYLDKNNFKKEQYLSDEEIQYLIHTELKAITDPKLKFIKEMCISLQYVIVEQLTRKLSLAIDKYTPQSLGISGGVSANPLLRNEVKKLSSKVFIPPLYLTGDNAIMIVLSGIIAKYHNKI